MARKLLPRQLGAVSRSIDFIHSSLLLPSSDPSPAKLGALVQTRRLLQTIIDQARSGDADCGYFLAQLTAFLQKARTKFEVHNETFREDFPKLESARITTKKSSALRPRIERLISEVCARRRKLAVARELRVARFSPDPDNLLALPEFGDSQEAIDRWTWDVVYPYLKAIESELAADPEIAKIKKAWGQGGTFRVSRLKVLIKDTVARIARNPPPYYFHIA
jgi:hypothetical protein